MQRIFVAAQTVPMKQVAVIDPAPETEMCGTMIAQKGRRLTGHDMEHGHGSPHAAR